MIDLHCHILPGIDDGAPDLDTALEMARVAVADGITITACTPHIHPGAYDNEGPGIKAAILALQDKLDEAGIPLKLVCGADVHIDVDLPEGLRSGRIARLNDTDYFLFEPPHHVAPPRLEEVVFDVMAQGWRPILTHPERLSWIEDHYEIMVRLAQRGVLMQVTGGSVEGRFGKRPRYWAERMLDEGLVHILATDAHNLRNRRPELSPARDAVAERLGEAEAVAMVDTRPAGILAGETPPDPETIAPSRTGRKSGSKRVLSWLRMS